MKIYDGINNFTVMTTIFAGVLISLLIFHLKRLHMYKLAANYDGPTCVPFVGNALLFVGSTTDILKKMCKFLDMYATSPLRFWLGPELIFISKDPEQIKQVLSDAKIIDKSKPFDFVKPCLGNGLVTATGETWRFHRKLIAPTFNMKILETYVDKFAAHSKNLVKNMEKELDGKEFEIADYTAEWAMDVICETTMGSSLTELGDPERRMVESVHRAAEIGYKRLFKPWLYWDVMFYQSSLGKEFEVHRKFVHDIMNKAIEQRRDVLFKQILRNAEKNPNKDTCSPEFEKKSYLDHLIGFSLKHSNFSTSDIRDELLTMVVGGNESTGFTISTALFLLANYPSVQEEVYREIVEIFGTDDLEEREINFEDFSRLEYLERVIKETLRLFPPLPFNARLITEDLEIGGKILPKGCIWAVVIFQLHRNAKYWENPLEFNPDRFLPDEIAKRHSHSWLPFSVGPRYCVGSKYAMMKMKTVLVTALRRYNFRKDKFVPISEIDVKADFIAKTAIPLKLRIERRVPQASDC